MFRQQGQWMLRYMYKFYGVSCACSILTPHPLSSGKGIQVQYRRNEKWGIRESPVFMCSI